MDDYLFVWLLMAMMYVFGMSRAWPYVWKGMEESRRKHPGNFTIVLVVIVCACICMTWPFWVTLGLFVKRKRGD